MKTPDYEHDMRIDESALDVEWLNQPILAMSYGKYYAECFKRFQQAEENIKLVKADLIRLINDDPDKYLGEGVKPTAVNVESGYRKHKDHKAAKEEWIDAQYELNIVTAAKSEISFSRKAALENLVILHGHLYFAGPTMPRDLSYEQEQREKQQKSNAGVRSKMERKKV